MVLWSCGPSERGLELILWDSGDSVVENKACVEIEIVILRHVRVSDVLNVKFRCFEQPYVSGRLD